MTLDEFIKWIQINKHLYHQSEFEVFMMYLKELKALRVELEKNSKELEAYKKALEISCEWNELNLGYLNVDECLQKARGEEE